MTHTGRPAGTVPPGARPGPGSTSGCKTCGHPVALHSNGKTECKAFACTAGPDHGPCAGFTAAEEQPGEGTPALLAS